MCEWGVANPWRWAPEVGNSWRSDSDISPSWSSILRCLDNGIVGLSKFAGPGGWNDPDMLEVGWVGAGGGHVAECFTAVWWSGWPVAMIT
jgi:alpha-galactosidase